MEYIPTKNKFIPNPDLAKIRQHLEPADYFLCEILRATGLRVDDLLESVNLNWKFAELGLIVICEKKTDKIREIEASEELLDLIRKFRTAYGVPESYIAWDMMYFVPSWKKYDTHLNRSTLFRHFQKACRRSNLGDKGYTIHSLRKCYAVSLYHASKSILAVQRALNHDHMETTMIYLLDALPFML